VEINLIYHPDLGRMLRRKLDARDHWFLIPDFEHMWLLEEIEEKFYDGEANRDFDIYVGPLSLATAKKSRMGADELHAVVKDSLLLPLSPSDLESHDVLFLCGPKTAHLFMEAFLDLLNVPKANQPEGAGLN
jgi:hypothetical protein